MDERHYVITDAESFGETVKEIRGASGLDQETFGAMAGVSRSFVSDLERGKKTAELERALRTLIAAGYDLVAIPR